MSLYLPYPRSNERLEYIGTGIAPHSATVRSSLTGLAGVKDVINSFYVRLRRATAATTNGFVVCMLSYTPNGGTARAIAGVELDNNTAGKNIFDTFMIDLVITYLDVLSIVTYDLSTGGSIDYSATVQYFVI